MKLEGIYPLCHRLHSKKRNVFLLLFSRPERYLPFFLPCPAFLPPLDTTDCNPRAGPSQPLADPAPWSSPATSLRLQLPDPAARYLPPPMSAWILPPNLLLPPSLQMSPQCLRFELACPRLPGSASPEAAQPGV
jgi:hypothetical protein